MNSNQNIELFLWRIHFWNVKIWIRTMEVSIELDWQWKIVNDMFLYCVFQGVCCQDEEHCCPPSYSCDIQQHRCVRNIHSIPWVEKRPALPRRSLLSVGKTVCPGGAMTCEDHETCCPLATGGYGCCPFDQVGTVRFFLSWIFSFKL